MYQVHILEVTLRIVQFRLSNEYRQFLETSQDTFEDHGLFQRARNCLGSIWLGTAVVTLKL